MNFSLVNTFTRLERDPVIEVMTKEVLGINVPKTAIVRSGNEMADVAFNEFGNTVGFFGGGFLLDRLLNRVYRGVGSDAVSVLWKHTGKSVALCSVLFSLMWAMPFFRNYLTAVRTGTDNYAQVIGSGNLSRPKDPEAFEKRKAGYLKTAFSTLGIGLGVAVSSVIGSRLAIRRGIALTSGGKLGEALKSPGKLGAWALDKIRLAGGKFREFGDVHAALFWGLPAYGGWIHASRDKYERKEQVLKAANFFVWFFALPFAIRRAFVSKFPQQVRKVMQDQGKSRITRELIEASGLKGAAKDNAVKLWVRQSVTSLVSSLVLLGVSPTVLNIWLTKQRLARQQGQPEAQFSGAAIPSGQLRHKSFEAFLSARYNQNSRVAGGAAYPAY